MLKTVMLMIGVSSVLHGADTSSLDISAERARREALRQANRAKEEEQLRKSGAPYLIHHVQPRFPIAEKGNFRALRVTITVDEKGIVRGVAFQDEPDLPFELAALEAIFQWRYSPRKIAGAAVRSEVFELIKFNRPPRQKANKALEPTPGSVTPHASSGELK